MQAYKEETHLGLWITGKRVSGSWIHADEESSFFELKAHVLNIFRRIGLPLGSVVFKESSNNIYHKGLSVMNRGGKLLAELGIICKKLQRLWA